MKGCDGKVYRIVRKTVRRKPGWRRQGGERGRQNDVGGEGVKVDGGEVVDDRLDGEAAEGEVVVGELDR